MRGLSDRKLLRLEAQRKELEFKREELEYIDFCLSQMGKLLGFKNIDEINSRTGHPYISLKILLSLYRRVRTLVKYEVKGRPNLTTRSNVGPKLILGTDQLQSTLSHQKHVH